MRSLVLIFLMVMVPFQWSWATAAALCEHETGAHASHYGHHEHEHRAGTAETAEAAAEPRGAGDEADQPIDGKAGKLAGAHADCGTCHAATVCLPSVAGLHAHWSDTAAFAPYESAIVRRVADTPLRPPLLLVS